MILFVAAVEDEASCNEPKFFCSANFFERQGRGATKGSWLYLCKRCVGGKLISTHYKSRYNLRQHIVNKHRQSLGMFDAECNENDGRRSKRTRGG